MTTGGDGLVVPIIARLLLLAARSSSPVPPPLPVVVASRRAHLSLSAPSSSRIVASSSAPFGRSPSCPPPPPAPLVSPLAILSFPCCRRRLLLVRPISGIKMVKNSSTWHFIRLATYLVIFYPVHLIKCHFIKTPHIEWYILRFLRKIDEKMPFQFEVDIQTKSKALSFQTGKKKPMHSSFKRRLCKY